MIEIIGTPAMLEQLAEESAELSQAALKVARILRGENPTPVLLGSAKAHLQEEYTDVIQCANELRLLVDPAQIKDKEQRFQERVQAAGLSNETVTMAQNRDLRKVIHNITGGPFLTKTEWLAIIKIIGAVCDRNIKEEMVGANV